MSTIEEELKWGLEYLAGSESARLDSQILLAYVLECERIKLMTWPKRRVVPDESRDYRRLVERRAEHEPVAYLVGEKEFWSRNFIVTNDTLIPRPETEKLIEVALELLPQRELTILDIGTGSGIIACTLALACPAWRLVGLDLSEAALEIAKVNAERLGSKNTEWLHSDWLSAWKGGRVDVIISNPPYLKANDQHLIKDLSFEPVGALVAGETGLEAYEILIPQAVLYLKKGGILLFEHGYTQASALQELLKKCGFSDVKTYNDLSGLPRVTTGQWITD